MKISFLPVSIRQVAATVAGVLLATTALAQNPAAGVPAATPAAKPLGPMEKNFVRSVGKSLNHLLKLAEAGKNPAVTEDKHMRFRDKANSDVKKALEGLTKMASARGETVEMELAPADKADLERLGKLKEERFLKEWIGEMAKEAKKVDRDFQSGERSLQDPDVKSYIANYTPMIRTMFNSVETQERGLKKK